MQCRRCKQDNSNQISFYFQEKRVRLEATVCRVCGFVHADDEELLKAARKHLALLCQPARPSQNKNSQKKS